MTYRGVTGNSAVVLIPAALAAETLVNLVLHEEPASPCEAVQSQPAVRIWKDRPDLPDDSVESSKVLHKQLMRRPSEP